MDLDYPDKRFCSPLGANAVTPRFRSYLSPLRDHSKGCPRGVIFRECLIAAALSSDYLNLSIIHNSRDPACWCAYRALLERMLFFLFLRSIPSNSCMGPRLVIFSQPQKTNTLSPFYSTPASSCSRSCQICKDIAPTHMVFPTASQTLHRKGEPSVSKNATFFLSRLQHTSKTFVVVLRPFLAIPRPSLYSSILTTA